MNAPLDLKHHFGGGVYIKEIAVPAGYILVQHKHDFDHLSYLVKGAVEVCVNGKIDVVHAPYCLEIKAGIHHGIKSLEDSIWLCIHATDCIDEEAIDDVLVTNKDMDDAHSTLNQLRGY